MRIDNFALTLHQTCPSKYNLRIRQHWTVRARSAALGFGGAMHYGLHEWYRTDDLQMALAAIENGWPKDLPVDDYRSLSKAIETMELYVVEYPNENFKVVGMPDDPMLEVSFTLDTGLKTEGGEPIEYGGIFDGIIDYGPYVYVLEHKTTSVMGATYFHQFKPNNQITGYVWAAGLLSNRKVGGAFINAIGIYKSQATRFERKLVTRQPEDIDEWLRGVKATCDEIEMHQRTGVWPMRTVNCTMYGLCEYHRVHSLTGDNYRKKMLEQDFVKSKWDYENRD